MLGPVIEIFENEVANPMLQRVISIMQRKGIVPPMPESLRGVQLKITYQSMARLAQEAAESVGLKDFAASMGTASLAAKNAGVPDPARVINWDEWARKVAKVTHLSLDLVFTKTEVAQNDAAREQAIKQQQGQEQVSSLAPSAVDAAKVLSQTDVEGGSYLSSLLTGNVAPS